MEYLLTYNVDTTAPAGQRRLRRVAKTCEGYGIPVQKAVFEETCTAAQLPALKQKPTDIIDHARDDIRLYRLAPCTLQTVERLGRAKLARYHHGYHIL